MTRPPVEAAASVPARPDETPAASAAPAAPVLVEDQRQHARRALELPASVRDAGNRVEGAIRFDTRDISLGGAFLRSDLLFEVGEELTVEFALPGGASIRVKARVVRVARGGAGAKEPAGMGVAFIDLAERDREAVRAVLERA